MFRNELETDLKKIFGLKKVVFSNVEYVMEQDVLYVNIVMNKNRPDHGGYYFKVTGTLGYNTQNGNTKNGWWHYKYLQSNHTNKQRLGLGSFETNVNFASMDKFFTKSRIDFTYRVRIKFDPSQKATGFISTIRKLLNI